MYTDQVSTKRVTFAANTKIDSTYIPLAKSIPRPSRARKKWLNCCRDGNYVQLSKDLELWKQQGLTIEKIFKTEGLVLLDTALRTSSFEPFEFICENVPIECIQEALNQDEFHVVDIFLCVETKMRKYLPENYKSMENLAKKINLLLIIDPDGMKKFLEKSLYEDDIGEEIKVEIKQALEEFNQSQKNNRKYFQDFKLPEI